MKWTLSLLISLIIFACSDVPSEEELQKFAATETYPEDTFLDTVSNKRALIIVAHDDDDCAMSGTIAKLKQDGWYIKQLSLGKHVNKAFGMHAADIISEGNELIIPDGHYRLGVDTMKYPYYPISREKILKQYLHQKVADSLISKINRYQPSVIFTLDNIKGGYGHPDHVFISEMVLGLFQRQVIQNQRIYQSVYTDHMEHEIVDTWLKAKMEKWNFPHTSTIANELYGITGMPEPDVQVNIEEYGQIKMEYLNAYPEKAKKNLRKFIPYYEEFDAKTYFRIFDREFFRVIDEGFFLMRFSAK